MALFFSCGTKQTKENNKNDKTTLIENDNAAPVISTLDSIKKDMEMIIGEQGSAFVLPKNCFLDENGNPVNDNITIELKEVNQMQDFVDGGVSTISNGRLLKTGGSYYFNATANEKNLVINKNNKPVALLPNIKKDREMRFFIGKLNDKNEINWIADSNKKEADFIEPFNLNANFTSEMEFAKCYIESINKYYVKQGDFWRFTQGEGFATCVGLTEVANWLVQQNLRKFRFLSALYDKRKKLLDNYNSYVRKYNEELIKTNPEAADQALKLGIYDPYQYELDYAGWFNCDKFVNEQMVKITFTAKDHKNQPRLIAIHLIENTDRVHIKSIVEKEGSEFSWPSNKDLEIIYYTNDSKKMNKIITTDKPKEITLQLESK